ncbi:hypothetical protein SESBI_19975 [Sesbania bispinosa]|nr:hypothetical protein SESBI_19975 [Sesbania bispinosa]
MERTAKYGSDLPEFVDRPFHRCFGRICRQPPSNSSLQQSSAVEFRFEGRVVFTDENNDEIVFSSSIAVAVLHCRTSSVYRDEKGFDEKKKGSSVQRRRRVRVCRENKGHEEFRHLEATVNTLFTSVEVMSGQIKKVIETQSIALVIDVSNMKDKAKWNPSAAKKDTKTEDVTCNEGSTYEISGKNDDAHLTEALPKNEEEYDIVVDVSDQEDNFERILQWTPKAKTAAPTPKSVNSPPKMIRSFGKEEYDMYYSSAAEKSLSVLASNFQKGVRTEVECGTYFSHYFVMRFKQIGSVSNTVVNTNNGFRKASQDTSMPRKRNFVQNPNTKEALKKAKNKVLEADSSTNSPSFGKLAPKFVRTKFRPLKETHLTSKEECIASYDFQVDGDASEVIYKLEDACFTRKDLYCFCFPNEIRHEV